MTNTKVQGNVVEFKIESIDGGFSRTFYDKSAGCYTRAIGIDPDQPINAGAAAFKTSGAITPVNYAKFSDSAVTDGVIAMINQPKVEKIFMVLNNGRIVSYDQILGSETLVGTVAGGKAKGAAYYNNFVYISGTGFSLKFKSETLNFTIGQVVTGGTSGAHATLVSQRDDGATGVLNFASVTGTFQDREAITDPSGGSAVVDGVMGEDISCYGPLVATGVAAGITDFVWTLGAATNAPFFGQAPLSIQNYPTLSQIALPAHWMHLHGDDALYISDFSRSQGMLHRLKTKQTTFAGDTNDGSAYNVLDLPFGMMPTCIESYGTDLAVSAVPSASVVTLIPGKSHIYLWDTFADSFYNDVPNADPITSALFNFNNLLYVFSGSCNIGFRIAYYSGGRALNSVATFEDGGTPYPGAVDCYGDRIAFGSFTSTPDVSASVYSIGSKDPRTTPVIHNIVRTSASGGSPLVTALKYYSQASFEAPRLAIGWKSDTQVGIDKRGGATVNSIFWSQVFETGRKFVVREVFIPLSTPTASSFTISPQIYIDDANSNAVLPDINLTNFPGGRYNALFKNPKMDGTKEISGFHNFFLQFTWSGSFPASIVFPVRIRVELYDDEPGCTK